MTDVPRRSCFFCGPTNRRLTEEHVWPKWVSGLLCGRRNSFDHHFEHLKTTDDTKTVKWKSRYLDVTTKTVCEDCNCQWLSDFENRIKSLASPLMVGERVVALALTPESQALLAAWAYKMAMLLGVSHLDTSTEFFTPADRLRFRQTTSAHWFVHVFLSRYDFGPRPAHATILRQTFAQRPLYSELASITAGHLAMQVMSVRSTASNELVPAGESTVETSGLARETVLSIWPPVPGYLEWPPARTMSHQDVEEWNSMWIKAANLPERPDRMSRDPLSDA